MKLTLSALVGIGVDIQHIHAAVMAGADLPYKASNRLNRVMSIITPELRVYEDARKKLIEDLGTKSTKGNFYEFPVEGSAEKFEAQHKILLDEEVELTLPTLLSTDLGTFTKIGPASQLHGNVIVEPEEKKT